LAATAEALAKDFPFLKSEAVGDTHELRLGVVAIAGLLEAEAPERRERRGAGEPGVHFDDFFGVRAVQQIVIDGAIG